MLCPSSIKRPQDRALTRIFAPAPDAAATEKMSAASRQRLAMYGEAQPVSADAKTNETSRCWMGWLEGMVFDGMDGNATHVWRLMQNMETL